MYDKELALEVLGQIRTASQTILGRFKPVKTVSDFTDSPVGQEKLDSICMQLIAIGESLKKFDKITEGSLLPKYSQIDWKKAKGLRDIISHQYFDVNAEAIFDVCKTQIKPLHDTITQIIEDIK
ncbi:MAG TPA: DUF86 domain-containing protein [Planctomycetes bacterium]|nr:DUF86 domain-containing protein [Planctomycetota bacterium]